VSRDDAQSLLPQPRQSHALFAALHPDLHQYMCMQADLWGCVGDEHQVQATGLEHLHNCVSSDHQPVWVHAPMDCKLKAYFPCSLLHMAHSTCHVPHSMTMPRQSARAATGQISTYDERRWKWAEVAPHTMQQGRLVADTRVYQWWVRTVCRLELAVQRCHLK